jgi:Predicted membrane protein (DUF2157)
VANIDSKIDTWLAAEIIDGPTAARIRGFENAPKRPLMLWAVIGIGALTILLGIISLVAANWDVISAEARLTIHLIAFVAMAAFYYWRSRSAKGEDDYYFNDAGLVILGALGLSFPPHLGQAYQLDGPIWPIMMAWLVAFSPLMLLRGRGWPVALGWMAALFTLIISFMQEQSEISDDHYNFLFGIHDALLIALPVIAGYAASWWNTKSDRDWFWPRIAQLGLVWQLAVTSLLVLAAADDSGSGEKVHFLTIPLAALFALLPMPLLKLADRAEALGAITVAGACGIALLFASTGLLGTILPALLFIALWVAIAFASLIPGWRALFQVAVAVVALRVIILSFELSDDLFSSGLGLVLSGFIMLGVAWLAIRVGRKYAPEREAGDVL